MNKVVKNKVKDTIIEIVIEVLLGLAFLIWPRNSQSIVVYVVGSVFIALALVEFVFMLVRGFSLPFQIGLNVFLLIFGILLCSLNWWFVSVFPIVIGIYLLIRGVYQTMFSSFIGNKQSSELIFAILYGLVLIALGVTLMVIRENVEVVGYFIGASFLANAIFDAIYLFGLKKLHSKAQEAFSNEPPHNSSKSKIDAIDVDFTESEIQDDNDKLN